MPSRSTTALACLLPLLAAASAPAQTSAPTNEELLAEIKALKARLADLEARAVSKADVDAVVERVLRDADARSRIFDESMQLTAGFDREDNRFFIRSADKNFSVSPVLVIQARYIANYRDETPAGDKDHRIDDGFENRRLRFGLQGNFASEALTYRLVFAIDQGRSAVTRDAFLQYRFTPDFAVQFGQFKDPWSQEEIVSDSRQLAVERSLLNSQVGAANTARVEGVNLIFGQAEPWRAYAAVHDGAASSDTTFFNQPAEDQTPRIGSGEATFGATGRVEYFVTGTARQYRDYSARNNEEDLLVLAAGAELTQAGDNNALFHAVDVQWENTRGLGLFAEYVGLYREIGSASAGEAGVAAGGSYDYGFLAQAGYVVAPKWEIFARYAYIRFDEAAFTPDRSVRATDIHEITAGINYFLYDHNAKLTLDLTYLPAGTPDAPRLGYLATEENGFVLRTQFQLSL